MRFHKDADVVTSDGRRVGSVDQIVVDPDDTDVTHLVVGESDLLPRDSLIPIDDVDRTPTEETVVLREGVRPREFEVFIEDRYRIVTTERPMFGPPGFALYPLPDAPGDYLRWDAEAEGWGPTKRAGGTVAGGSSVLGPGDPVLTRDGRRLGRVEEIVTTDDGSIEGVVARSGFLWFGRRWRIPIGWICEIRDGALRIDATKAELLERAGDHDHRSSQDDEISGS